MARETIEKLIDDLAGGDATETVVFGLDGTSYEIDLNKRNAAALRKALDPYLKAGRRTTASRTPRRRPASNRRARASNGTSGRDFDIVALREWAGTNGVTVPSRGRIPQSVVEQYKTAGGH